MTEREFGLLYPELTGSGRLAAAIQASLDELGSRLRVDDPLGRAYAVVKRDRRSCQVMIALETRSFGTDFWDRGVQYGHLWCGDLTMLARALQHFLENRSSTDDLVHLWPKTTISEAARAHERGGLVDYAWSQCLQATSPTWPENVLQQVFTAAAARPRLRGLMPFTSLSRACFSTRTGYPYTRDCPMIEVLRTGECHVFVSATNEGVAPIFKGNVIEAVTVAEETLPASISNARDGTAEDDIV